MQQGKSESKQCQVRSQKDDLDNIQCYHRREYQNIWKLQAWSEEPAGTCLATAIRTLVIVFITWGMILSSSWESNRT